MFPMYPAIGGAGGGAAKTGIGSVTSNLPKIGGGITDALEPLGQVAAAAGLMGSGMMGPIFQLLDAREQAKLSRRTSRGLRQEAIPFLRELTGLTTVGGKGGVTGGAASPEIMAAQQLLASPRVYNESEIRGMQAARRMMSPRYHSLNGAATGSTLMRGMPAPTDMWSSIVQPRMEAMGYNESARRRAIATANQWRNSRFQLGAQQYVK